LASVAEQDEPAAAGGDATEQLGGLPGAEHRRLVHHDQGVGEPPWPLDVRAGQQPRKGVDLTVS
jgi:hypothetical protein